MTHEACKSKLRSVVRSSMHPYPGNRVAIGRAVVYYAWAARQLSAGIKCRHCITSYYLLCCNSKDTNWPKYFRPGAVHT